MSVDSRGAVPHSPIIEESMSFHLWIKREQCPIAVTSKMRVVERSLIGETLVSRSEFDSLLCYSEEEKIILALPLVRQTEK